MVSVRTYRVVATRESPWWLLAVLEQEVTTQARHWGEAELMAQDLIASYLDVPLRSVAVEIKNAPAPGGSAASP